MALILLAGLVVGLGAINHRGVSVVDACGKAGPSCRRCYVGVYTAQCPK
jgi:hypothetical protein